MIEFELENYCGLYRIAYKNDCFLADSYISWTWELPYALSHPMAYWVFELSSSREYLHTRVAGICHKKVAGRKTRGEWEIGLLLLLHLHFQKLERGETLPNIWILKQRSVRGAKGGKRAKCNSKKSQTFHEAYPWLRQRPRGYWKSPTKENKMVDSRYS